MKIVISPAKTLDFERQTPTDSFTVPAFLKQAKQVHKVLKDLNPSELSELLSISDKLADLNWQRNQSKGFGSKVISENARQAVYAFNGEVYTGLDAYSILPQKLDMLQDRLRILSGLYGMLKPLDLIQPYRLEMGIKLAVGDSQNLYEFWKTSVTKKLNSEMLKGELLVNLASKEYFSVLDKKLLKARVITPEFKDYSGGKLKMISFFAKKARGSMTRYIIDTNSQSIDDLKAFDYDGYAFDDKLSQGDTLTFTR